MKCEICNKNIDTTKENQIYFKCSVCKNVFCMDCGEQYKGLDLCNKCLMSNDDNKHSHDLVFDDMNFEKLNTDGLLDNFDSIEYLKSEVSRIAKLLKDYNDLKMYLSQYIHKQITTKNKIGDLEITEHCIVRYFERKLKYNIEEIKEKIINEKIQYIYNNIGKNPNVIDIDSEVSVLIKDGYAITILLNEESSRLKHIL